MASLFLELTAPGISESLLISAYDLHFGLLDRPERLLSEKAMVFLDSGGYELNPEYDSAEPKHYEYRPRNGFGVRQYRAVLDALDRQVPYVIANFDWATRRRRVVDQMGAAQKLYNDYAHWMPNFLVKPGSNRKGELEKALLVDRHVRADLPAMHPFKIVGVTEKELGSKLMDRLTTLASLRVAMDEAGLQNTPIHVWGGLDPVLTPLYFFAGGSIFDGVSWLRYAFREGLAVSWDAGTVLRGGLGESKKEADARTAAFNLTQMRVLTSAMKMFVASGGVDFSVFGANEGPLKAAYRQMAADIPALATKEIQP